MTLSFSPLFLTIPVFPTLSHPSRQPLDAPSAATVWPGSCLWGAKIAISWQAMHTHDCNDPHTHRDTGSGKREKPLNILTHTPTASHLSMFPETEPHSDGFYFSCEIYIFAYVSVVNCSCPLSGTWGDHVFLVSGWRGFSLVMLLARLTELLLFAFSGRKKKDEKISEETKSIH